MKYKAKYKVKHKVKEDINITDIDKEAVDNRSLEGENYLQSLFQKGKKNTQLIISISTVALVLFMVIAIAFPFRDRIFQALYPKPKSQAAVCAGGSKVPAKPAGFVFTGGDLGQAMSALNTSLYYSYDTNLALNRSVYMIGKYTQNMADPLGLRLLMENGLSNTEFKGLWGQVPAGWNSVTVGKSGSTVIDTARENLLSGRTSIKITNDKGSSGTQLSQVFKKDVSAGQFVVFGAWVRSSSPAAVRVLVQNSQDPYQEFGSAENNFKPNEWTFISGYGKVPAGIANFQLVMRVSGDGNKAWFDQPVAAVLGPEQNQTVANLVAERCGSAWIIDNEPGWDQTYSSPTMKALPGDLYALIYQQFYTLIKNADPSAIILPGSLAGAPVLFENSPEGYSPKTFLDNFRKSYKNFFGSEPAVDALGIGYIASDQSSWSSAKDLADYFGKFRSYINSVPEWEGKPIWITKLAASKGAPNEGVNFAKAALDFLAKNNLNITKWFWFDTCSSKSQLLPLFSSNNKICSWPMELSALGQAYFSLTSLPTPSPTLAAVPPTASPSATLTQAPTAIPPTATPTITPTVTLVPTDIPTPTVTPTTVPVTVTPEATTSATPTP